MSKKKKKNCFNMSKMFLHFILYFPLALIHRHCYDRRVFRVSMVDCV